MAFMKKYIRIRAPRALVKTKDKTVDIMFGYNVESTTIINLELNEAESLLTSLKDAVASIKRVNKKKSVFLK